MANTLLTPSDVVLDAALFLRDNLIIGNLVNRKTETRFATKVGDTVSVKAPAVLTAKEKTAGVDTTASDITESSVDVVLQKHLYQRVDLTSSDLTLKLEDFNTQVMMPAVRSLIAAIEDYGIRKIAGGFAPYLVGTAGNEASTHAHLLAAEKQIFSNKGPVSNLIGMLTATTHANLAQLNIMTSADYGTDRPAGLASNSLGRVANTTFFRSPEAGTFSQGDIAGTVLTNGDPGTGTTINIDGLTAATGTIYEGTRFTIADDTSSTTYTTTADATIASNAAALSVTPAADASVADNKALTFETAFKENILYDMAGAAGAFVPPVAGSDNAATEMVDNVGLRIVNDTSVDSLATVWVFDLFVGFKVVQPKFGALIQG